VGQERFARFLRASADNAARASDLYEQDIRLRDAFRAELEHVELAIRTRFHRELTSRREGRQIWLLDQDFPGRRMFSPRDLGTLSALALGSVSHEEAVSRVGFASWHKLTSAGLESDVWHPYLRHAFDEGTARSLAHGAIGSVVAFRNRVHHYRPIFESPLGVYFSQIVWLLDQLAPDLAKWRRAESAVPAALAELEGLRTTLCP
jgi:hypothetical protein